MKRTYSLFQEYIAYGLLVSFFLQSCGGFNNPIIPIQNEPATLGQSDPQVIIPQTNTLFLIEEKLIAKGGHSVTFYKQAGQLKANVEMNAPQGFSKTYAGLSVAVEQGAELANLSRLDTKAQERRIHLQLAQGQQPAKVVIYKGAGLAGGMQEGEEVDEDEDESIPNECFCPITQEIMDDPVIAQDGHTYERTAIKRWLDMGKRVSPKTGARLLSTELISNHAMHSLIEDLKEQVPVLSRHKLDMRHIEAAIKLREEEIAETLTQKRSLIEKADQARLNLAQELEEKTAQLKILQQRVKALEEQVHSFLEKDKKMHALMLQMQQCVGQPLSGQLISSNSSSSNFSNENSSIVGRNEEGRTIGINNIEEEVVVDSDLSEEEIEEMPTPITYDAPHKGIIEEKLAATQQKTYLYLECMGLKKDDIIFLVNHPMFKDNCKTYQKISLKRNAIGAECAILVAQQLQGTNVQELELGGTDIGTEGAIELVKHLRGTNIHKLGLFINGIGNRGAMELAGYLQETNVHTIELGANGITYYMKKLLQEKYPHIKWIF
jgi:hypothetical protein